MRPDERINMKVSKSIILLIVISIFTFSTVSSHSATGLGDALKKMKIGGSKPEHVRKQVDELSHPDLSVGQPSDALEGKDVTIGDLDVIQSGKCQAEYLYYEKKEGELLKEKENVQNYQANICDDKGGLEAGVADTIKEGLRGVFENKFKNLNHGIIKGKLEPLTKEDCLYRKTITEAVKKYYKYAEDRINAILEVSWDDDKTLNTEDDVSGKFYSICYREMLRFGAKTWDKITDHTEHQCKDRNDLRSGIKTSVDIQLGGLGYLWFQATKSLETPVAEGSADDSEAPLAEGSAGDSTCQSIIEAGLEAQEAQEALNDKHFELGRLLQKVCHVCDNNWPSNTYMGEPVSKNPCDF